MKSKVVLYKGKRGAGKTLTMVKDGFKYYLNGIRVLRNFYCSFGEEISEEEILNLDKDSDLNNCVIMMDELQIFFDSRRSMKKENMKFSNFIQQVRKRNIIILGTTQYSNTIDLRLRQHIDILAYPKFDKNFEVCEVTYLDMTSVEDDLFSSFSEPVTVTIVYDAKPLFSMFVTEEMK